MKMKIIINESQAMTAREKGAALVLIPPDRQ
jgi:hypothetical protein